MEVNASTLISTQKSFRALFLATFDAFMPSWQKHAMVVPSTTKTVVHQWLGRVAQLREWVDTKVITGLSGFDYTVSARDWESTLGLDRNDIEDDLLGMYTPRIQDLAQRAKAHPDKLLSQRRIAGATATGLCYDGQQFYDTDHAEGSSSTQANTFAGAGTTAANIRTDWFKAIAAFRKFKDDKGEPFILSIKTDDLIAVIPPDLEPAFDELNNPAPGATVPKTPIIYEVDPYLTDTNDWYVDYVGAPVKPFIKQDRKPVDFVALDDPTSSESVFLKKQFLYGVEGRYEIAYGLWQMSQKITNT